MIRIRSGLALGCLLSFVVVASGCGSSGAARTPEPAAGSSNVLTSLEVDGHTVKFIELRPGEALVEDTAAIGTPPLALAHSKLWSLADVYQRVRPGATVPSALLEADTRILQARQTALQSELTSAPPPADSPVPNAHGAKFYTAGEEQWFTQTFCDPRPVQICQATNNNSLGVVGPWEDTSHMEMEGMVEAEGQADAIVELNEWVCNGSSCSEQVVYWRDTFPGNYTEWLRIGAIMWRRSAVLPFVYSGPFMIDEYAYTCFDSSC